MILEINLCDQNIKEAEINGIAFWGESIYELTSQVKVFGADVYFFRTDTDSLCRWNIDNNTYFEERLTEDILFEKAISEAYSDRLDSIGIVTESSYFGLREFINEKI